MQNIFIEYIFLILIILALIMLSNKLRVAYPIILVLGGLAISFLPFFSNISIDPELVFFIFLPPLLYEASWQVSWKEFWKWRRSITSFAFPIVIITACVIAVVSNALIPGFTLALGFLLGGIISPPDAISATTIMRKVKVPKSLVSIAEGESLLNDASSLIIFRFALAAIITGHFDLQDATLSFFVVIIMGIFLGLLVGYIFYWIHRLLPTTASIEIILTLVTPYCMYISAEYFHFSGVLAVVSGGLFLSSKRQSMLNYLSRIQGINVWNNVIFVLNGLIFLLIGLQLPVIIAQLGETSIFTATVYGLIISLTLIITRLLCTLGASGFTRMAARFIKVADPNPGWKLPLVFGWAGMRGVVSLAAALSIPLIIHGNYAFPYRDLILYITFIVILMTLVLQGLTLPWLIKKLDLTAHLPVISDREKEIKLRKLIAQRSLIYLENKHASHDKNDIQIKDLFSKINTEFKILSEATATSKVENESPVNNSNLIYIDLLNYQRELLEDINLENEFDEELIRKYQLFIDIEELQIRKRTV